MSEKTITERYELNRSIKGIMTIGLAFFSLGLVGSIFMCFVEPSLILNLWWIWIPVIISYIVFVKWFYSAWKQRNFVITIDDTAIAVNSNGKQLENLEWSDVIKVKESHYLNRITLLGKFHKQIKLDYQINNFHELLQYAIEKMDHLKKSFSSYRKFHKTYQLRITIGICILFFGCSAYYSIQSDEVFQSIPLIVLSLIAVYPLIKEFTAVEIENESIIIRYPLKRDVIGKSEIQDIFLETMSGNYGDSFPVVNLILKNSKSIKLSSVREGTIPLYCSIKSIIVQGR